MGKPTKFQLERHVYYYRAGEPSRYLHMSKPLYFNVKTGEMEIAPIRGSTYRNGMRAAKNLRWAVKMAVRQERRALKKAAKTAGIVGVTVT